jgi:hypothetical protein
VRESENARAIRREGVESLRGRWRKDKDRHERKRVKIERESGERETDRESGD